MRKCVGYKAATWAAVVTSALLCSCQGSPSELNEPREGGSSGATPETRLREQRDDLERMQLDTLTFNRAGAVRLAQGKVGLALSPDERTAVPGQRGDRIFARLRKLLLAEGTETLTLRTNDVLSPIDGPGQGYRTLRYAQSIRGIPVIDGEVSIGTNSSGVVDVMSSTFLPATGLPERATVSAEEAFETARRELETAKVIAEGSFERQGAASLAYYGATQDADRPRLVWVLPASFTLTESAEADEGDVWVDAVEGTYVDRASHVRHFSPRVRVFTANNAGPRPENYPAGLTEIPNIGSDALATAARANIATTENAWVGRGLPNYPPIDIVVHYAQFANGFFTTRGGINYLSFGDGSNVRRSPSLVLDFVAHEYGHGVVNGIRPLSLNVNESRAIDEAFGDISGVLTEASLFGLRFETFEMFESLLINPIFPGKTSERSLNNPVVNSISPQSDYYPLRTIHSGTQHFNSTVVSHAFKLMVTGGMAARAGQVISPGAQVPTVTVTPLGLGLTVSLFEAALRSPQATFDMTIPQFAAATESTFLVLDPLTREAIHNAWVAVGVFGSGCNVPPSTPKLNVEDLFCNSAFRLSWAGVPGATTYHAEYVPSGVSWSLAAVAVDAAVNGCLLKLGGPSLVRLQACNGCGCSAFDSPGMLFPTSGCK